MADIAIAPEATAAHLISLTPATAQLVIFPRKRSTCSVTNTSDFDIYVRTDGIPATVGGDKTDLVPARSIAKVRFYNEAGPTQGAKVSVISAGAAKCSVSAS